MMKKRYDIIVSIVVISLFLCSVSFAQDDIDLPSGRRLVYQDDLSTWAFNVVETRFNEVKTYLEDIRDNLPPEKEQQKVWIDHTIALLESRRAQVDDIDIYIIDVEAYPGQHFDDVYAYFEGEGFSLQKEDLAAKQKKAEEKAQHIKETELLSAIRELPSDKISDNTKEALIALIEGGNVKVARGKKTLASKTERISILTVYIVPDPSDPTNYELIEKTTVVIATDTP